MSTPAEAKDQLHDELSDLDGKIGRLQLFLNEPTHRASVSAAHWGLLEIQVFCMQAYAECLMNRMKELDSHNDDEPAP